jgi:hypothetical protein
MKSDKKTKQSKSKEMAHKAIDEMHDLMKKAKEKFESADEKTRKKIITGVVGATALIAGVIGLKKSRKKKGKKEE